MALNPPRGVPRVLARLAYREPADAAAWLAQAFGFEEDRSARLQDANGRVTLTDIRVMDSRVMIGTSGPHGIQSPTVLGGRNQMLIVYVDGIDTHFARARDAGATILSLPTDMPWGDRRYEALDYEGHAWSFNEHLRDP
jgi:uncharacterized glyoxalase superfamily protein PhnB